jgi:asparagine synthase (glutamine-hydrolysing)
MLKAHIALSDLSLDAQRMDGFIALGASRITPYAHPMLETLLVRTENQWFVTVRERRVLSTPDNSIVSKDVDAETFHRLYQECVLWPLDYLLIEVAKAGCRMRVRAGVLGSVPVYCHALNDHVIVSWDFSDFATAPLTIDPEIASHRLALNTVYSARQLCAGVNLLTERASFHVEPGRASYRYPAPAPDTAPSSLPAGSDALTMFGERLQQVVSARPVTASRMSFELSGGMDSATVASAMASRHEPMASLGILLDGDVRAPQVQRRQLIAQRLHLSDETIDIARFPPSLDLQPHPDRAKALHWEYYQEACATLWDSARNQGRNVLFTGVGGDELFPAYADETQERRDDQPNHAIESHHHAEQLLTPRALNAARTLRTFDAPASPVPATSLLTHACRGPDQLRHGQWPVNPLSDPGLVALCHRLPRASRHGREVMRQYLQSRLGSEVFPHGYTKETFSQVLPTLISRQVETVASQLRECALADLGLVDQRAALKLLHTVAETRAEAPMSALASFLWLERCVRQLS